MNPQRKQLMKDYQHSLLIRANTISIIPHEADYRLSIFNKNVEMINRYNADSTQTYTLGINEFTDMTYEELSNKYLSNFETVEGTNKCEKYGLDMTEDIEEIDWDK